MANICSYLKASSFFLPESFLNGCNCWSREHPNLSLSNSWSSLGMCFPLTASLASTDHEKNSFLSSAKTRRVPTQPDAAHSGLREPFPSSNSEPEVLPNLIKITQLSQLWDKLEKGEGWPPLGHIQSLVSLLEAVWEGAGKRPPPPPPEKLQLSHFGKPYNVLLFPL